MAGSIDTDRERLARLLSMPRINWSDQRRQMPDAGAFERQILEAETKDRPVPASSGRHAHWRRPQARRRAVQGDRPKQQFADFESSAAIATSSGDRSARRPQRSAKGWRLAMWARASHSARAGIAFRPSPAPIPVLPGGSCPCQLTDCERGRRFMFEPLRAVDSASRSSIRQRKDRRRRYPPGRAPSSSPNASCYSARSALNRGMQGAGGC